MSRGGYYDLNINVDRNDKNHLNKLHMLLKAAYKYGYDTVAVNTVLEPEMREENTPKGSKRKRPKEQNEHNTGKSLTIPEPLTIMENSYMKNSNLIPGRKLKILQRLTVPLSNASNTYRLTSNEAKKYDILAVQPLTEKAFQVCVSTLEMDLISFELGQRIPFMLRSQQVGQALERGMFFEITYAPMFIDSTARRNAICVGRHIVEACRGKNIIVSSEAKLPLHLRGPYDVINLCNVFGLKEPETAKILSENGKALTLKSECRLSGKGVFVITPITQVPEDDQWKTLNCQNDADVAVEKGLTKKRKITKKTNGESIEKKIRTT